MNKATNTELLPNVRALLKGLRGWWLFCNYRASLAQQKRYVQSGARILCQEGVAIGLESAIHGGAVVAAGYLTHTDTFASPAFGRVVIGDRCLVLPYAVLASYGGEIEIGNDVSINPGVVIYGHGNVRIGDKTRIGAHALIVASRHNYQDASRPVMEQGSVHRPVVIGKDVWIASGARVFDGVTIGDRAVVASGAVVQSDVQTETIVAGVPARAVGMRK